MFAARRVGNLQETLAFLNCRRLPGRLNLAETAVLLGFQEHDIAALISAKLLAPLGKPCSEFAQVFRFRRYTERSPGSRLAFTGYADALQVLEREE
jgi:hypothetical protein